MFSDMQENIVQNQTIDYLDFNFRTTAVPSFDAFGKF